ncbi:hypothetical protein KFE25_005700 [Diacronema lutheri]|uniref:EF-hand domain-containing protein n=1 Tax=Diacronema lutheri TaxID=2081491 RepID=A0A8J6C3B9_DIALT|nr:hypothetical protein KFE25_005700 [Diacronema lutheri]
MAEDESACRYCGESDRPNLSRTCDCPGVAHASCVLRRRALSLDACLASGGRRGRGAFAACERCGSPYAVPLSTQQLGRYAPRVPYAWAMLVALWLVDAAALIVAVHALSLAVALPIRLALVAAVMRAADADGSGRLELSEAVELARATGDEAGVHALPSIIRHLPPRGEDALSARALRMLYLQMWPPNTLARDAQTLGLLAPRARAWWIAQPTPCAGAAAAPVELGAAWPALPWGPDAVGAAALGGAAALLVIVGARGYCARVRARLATALTVAVCDAHAVRECGAPHPAHFWAAVLAMGRPRARAHVLLAACALSAGAQWLCAAAAWLADARVLRARLLGASLQRWWSPRPLSSSLAPLIGGGCDAAEVEAWTWAASVALCAAACAADVLALPLLAALVARA